MLSNLLQHCIELVFAFFSLFPQPHVHTMYCVAVLAIPVDFLTELIVRRCWLLFSQLLSLLLLNGLLDFCVYTCTVLYYTIQHRRHVRRLLLLLLSFAPTIFSAFCAVLWCTGKTLLSLARTGGEGRWFAKGSWAPLSNDLAQSGFFYCRFFFTWVCTADAPLGRRNIPADSRWHGFRNLTALRNNRQAIHVPTYSTRNIWTW